MSEELTKEQLDYIGPDAVIVNEKSPPALNAHQRLAKAMHAVRYIQKDPLKKGMQYRVVTHDKVTTLVRPALLEAGLVYYPQDMTHTQNGNRTEVTLSLAFVNVDNPEDRIVVPGLGYGIDTQDKGPGKAISYAVKYCLLKALGLETGDDPDLDQKTEHVMTAPDGTAVPTLEEALEQCGDEIDIIIDGIDRGEYGSAADAWFGFTGGQKMALFVPKSKKANAPFTTKHREVLKSREFREAASYGAFKA